VEEKLDADPYRHGGSEGGAAGCRRARLAQGGSVPRVLAGCLCWRGLSGQRWSGVDRVKRPTRSLRSRSAAIQSGRLGAMVGDVLGQVSDWLAVAQTPPSLSVSLCPTTRSRRPALPFPRPSPSPPSTPAVPGPLPQSPLSRDTRFALLCALTPTPAACPTIPSATQPPVTRRLHPRFETDCSMPAPMYIETTASGPGPTHPTVDRWIVRHSVPSGTLRSPQDTRCSRTKPAQRLQA
jgi:hypothetical protein